MMIREVFNGRITSISGIPATSSCKIYNTDVKDAFYSILRDRRTYFCSEYTKGIVPGTETAERVFCQDIERLTFEDESFDVVISEDVFEHVRDHVKGFREVFRVLKPGGCHIFTVPCDFDKKTVARVDVSGSEEINILPPEYHGGPVRGKILCYRNFGSDIFDLLKGIGFESTVDFSEDADKKHGIFESYVFVSRKPDVLRGEEIHGC